MSEADGNKMMLAGEIQKANEKKAKEENKLVKIDTDLEYLQNRVWEEYQMTYADAKQVAVSNFDIKEGSVEAQEVKRQIQKLGTVNLAAIEDIKVISERYEELTKHFNKFFNENRTVKSIKYCVWDYKLSNKNFWSKDEDEFFKEFYPVLSNQDFLLKLKAEPHSLVP